MTRAPENLCFGHCAKQSRIQLLCSMILRKRTKCFERVIRMTGEVGSVAVSLKGLSWIQQHHCYHCHCCGHHWSPCKVVGKGEQDIYLLRSFTLWRVRYLALFTLLSSTGRPYTKHSHHPLTEHPAPLPDSDSLYHSFLPEATQCYIVNFRMVLSPRNVFNSF